jgi:hypothetical protein
MVRAISAQPEYLQATQTLMLSLQEVEISILAAAVPKTLIHQLKGVEIFTH